MKPESPASRARIASAGDWISAAPDSATDHPVDHSPGHALTGLVHQEEKGGGEVQERDVCEIAAPSNGGTGGRDETVARVVADAEEIRFPLHQLGPRMRDPFHEPAGLPLHEQVGEGD